MAFSPSATYWLAVPAGRYRVGVDADEGRTFAKQSADWLAGRGVDLSPNEGKMMRRAAELLETSGNPAWVERYVATTYPARQVELAAFAIARRPITNREYRAFMADTKETQEPSAWARSKDNAADDRPARGVPWWIAIAIADWAGCRLPFADEWESAVRGAAHRLFPWGNQLLPTARRSLLEGYEHSLPADSSHTSEGFDGALTGSEEWCADLAAGSWGRLTAGGRGGDPIVPATIARTDMARASYAIAAETATVRLVRRDGRSVPSPDPATPPGLLALGPVRQLESRVIRPILNGLQRSRVGHDHTIAVDRTGHYRAVPGALKLWLATNPNSDTVIATVPTEWTAGLSFVAASRETVRRVPKEHGIFAWCIQYRVDERGHARARPVTAFRMAFDKAIHRFENRFDELADTAVDDITPAMIQASIMDAFQFYELHADADRDPFTRG